jgi:hypothetical protein
MHDHVHGILPEPRELWGYVYVREHDKPDDVRIYTQHKKFPTSLASYNM